MSTCGRREAGRAGDLRQDFRAGGTKNRIAGDNTRRMQAGDTIVVDIGAEYSGYSADVTRTFPASGKFSPRQREIYQIVLDAQKTAIAKVKPGARISDLHNAAMSHTFSSRQPVTACCQISRKNFPKLKHLGKR